MFNQLKQYKLYNIWFKYFPFEVKEIMKNILYRILFQKDFFYNYIYLLRIKRKQPILIYSMEKSGSTSIYYSLRDYKIKNVYRFHFLNPNRHLEQIQNLIFIGKRHNKRFWKRYYPFSWFYLKIINKKKAIKIISIVRNPFSRTISKFSHNFELYNDYKGIMESCTISQLKSLFSKISQKIILQTIDYFDNEHLKVLGINVYDYWFNKAVDYQVIKKENIELLLLKLELKDNQKEKIIKDFLKLPNNFKLVRHNITKDFNAKYSKLKKEITFSKENIELIYNSSYYKQFYLKN